MGGLLVPAWNLGSGCTCGRNIAIRGGLLEYVVVMSCSQSSVPAVLAGSYSVEMGHITLN